MTASTRRVVIIGGSIAGLCAANLFERAGWSVVVAERTKGQLSGRGAGVVTHPGFHLAMAKAGVGTQTMRFLEVTGRAVYGRDGSCMQTLDLPQRLVAWGQIHAFLAGHLRSTRILSGRALTHFRQDEAGVTAFLEGGGELEGDLLVGADGLRSKVRELLGIAQKPLYAGYVAWRGLVDERALPAGSREDLMSRFTFGFPPGEQILGYPVIGRGVSSPGVRRFLNYVWYRPVSRHRTLADMLTGSDGNQYHDGIPPKLLRPDILAEIRADAAKVLPPQFADAVAGTAHPLLQPIFDFAAPAMTFGRVALIGDAAFVARPHCGMGVTKALEDAVALSEAFSNGSLPVAQALARYGAVRLETGRALVRHAQELGNCIARTPVEVETVQAEVDHLIRNVAVAPAAPPARAS